MRAWQVTGTGEPRDVVHLVDMPDPAPSEGEVAVDVHAVALGFPDFLLAKGLYHDKPDIPFVIAGEAAGTVRAVGPGVSGWSVGDRVVVAPGEAVFGRLAETLVVPAELLLPVPESMSWAEAAALFVAYQTAYMGLFRRGGLAADETLLVHGASGGVGSAAVQLGKACGASVIAVAGGPEKVDFCREMGADVVVDHREEDFVAAVKRVTGGRGADVVFDPVGGDIFDRSRKCIAVEGRLVVVGFASGTIPTVSVNHLLLKNYSVVGFRTRPFRDDPVYRRTVHDALVELYIAGKIRPPVDEVPLDAVVPALERIGGRQVLGRAVVRVRD